MQLMKSQKPKYRIAVIAYDEPFDPPVWVKERFTQAGIDCTIAQCFTEQEVVDLARDKDILLTSSARKLLTDRVIDRLNVCRALVRVGSGLDCIEVPSATAKGIMVVNTPDALTEEVSDHAAALLLDCVRHIARQDRLVVRSGLWHIRTLLPTKRIRGKTLGLIGLGRIAQALIEKLNGFDLTYLAYDPYVDPKLVIQKDIRLVGLEELLAAADFVSLHVPLTAETYHLIGKRELKLMPRHAILINTARGAIIDQTALYQALTEGWIAGAGLDVLEQEPPPQDDPLLQLENIVMTPHTAAFSDELMDALYEAGYRVTLELLAGKLPTTTVNPEVQPWWNTDPQ